MWWFTHAGGALRAWLLAHEKGPPRADEWPRRPGVGLGNSH